MDEQIRIALVDDEILITQLLEKYFNELPDFEVSLTANGGEQFLEQLTLLENIPQVVILDLKMEGMDGVETAALLKERYPEVKVIIMSSHYQKTFIGFMLRNGIDAFLPKGIKPDELARIVKIVKVKGHYFTREHIEVMRSQISGNVPKPAFEEYALSTREKEVLRLICLQYTAKEIADELFISQRTVEGHKNNLLLKSGAKNSAGLVIYAIQNNLFDPHELML